MPGPVTAILDSFTRADESPLAGGWLPTSLAGAAANVRVLSNQLAAIANSYGEAVWPGDFAADQEAFFTVPVFSAGWDISLRAAGVGASTWTGYTWESGSSSQQFYRVDASGPVAVGSPFGSTPSANDKFLYRSIGSTHEAWKLIGGVWTLQASRTDATYNQAGKIAFALWNGTGRFDDVGGGAYAFQSIRPDADNAAGGWATAPLWSKVDEASAGGDVISATSA